MKHLIDFRDFAYDGKSLWISAREFNGLIKLDFDRKEASYVTGFKNTTPNVELHGSVIDTEDKIYFIPSLESTMDIYDKRSGSVTSVSIYPQDMAWHCFSAYLVKQKIVLLPFQAEDIICYDIESGEILTINHWEDDNGMKFSAEGYFCCGCGVVRGERLYAVSQRNEGILELNMRNMSITWHHLYGSNMAFSTITDDSNSFWMSANKDNAFVRWDIKTGITRIFNMFPINYKFDKERGIPFCNIIDCDDKILAVAIRANMSLWLDKETGRITECKQLNQEILNRIDSNDIEEYRLAKKINRDIIVLVSCRDKAIIKYNWKQKKLERNFINATVEIQTGILKTTSNNEKEANTSLIFEEDMVTLVAFLNYINQKPEKQDIDDQVTNIKENMTDDKIGNKIFDTIKHTLVKKNNR